MQMATLPECITNTPVFFNLIINMHISFIIPAFNEEQLIEQCLHSLADSVADNQAYGYTHEIIVVDNNSTDKTAQLAARAGARLFLSQSITLHAPELLVQTLPRGLAGVHGCGLPDEPRFDERYF